MPTILSLLSWLLAAPIGLMLCYFSLEILMGLAPTRKRADGGAPHEDITILIPAHNEEDVIGATLRGLRQTAPMAHLLVVADNCNDRTAEIAREAGAEVVERHDTERRGKGYALAFGRDHLRAREPRVVMVLDADCRLEPGSDAAMIAAVESQGKAVQASNLFELDKSAPAMVQISNFAMLVKNLFRVRGMRRIGGTAMLFGTGMGFPWRIFKDLELASGEAVEDLGLAIRMIREGHRIGLAEQAKVFSRAASALATVGQRSRWEHGFMAHALKFALPSLVRGLAGFKRSLAALGIHMLIPPLALLMVVALVALAALACLSAAGASLLPLTALAMALALAVVSIALAWLAGGHRYLSARALALLPFYLIWKIPIYLRFVTARQLGWNRTPRDVTPGEH